MAEDEVVIAAIPARFPMLLERTGGFQPEGNRPA
jgi:hypothetical protein